MIESFADYAIAHEAGHAVVGQFVKIGAPTAIAFYLRRDSDGRLCLGDFATSFRFPPDEQIPSLPEPVKNCLCYTLAAGLAATQFRGLSLPDEEKGLDSDRARIKKLTSNPLESFLPHARAVIGQEQRALGEVISQCRRKYESLQTTDVDEGKQTLLTTEELEEIFRRTMSPLRAPLPVTEATPEFQATMSAHEAGHATLGITLGARIEAVYAVISDKLLNGNFRLCYLTKFGSPEKAGLDLKDRILLIAGGGAGEVLLNGRWDRDCVARDRADAENLGVSNFDYCMEQAVQLLRENEALLIAIRDKIQARMSNLKDCKLTKKGSHIILLKNSEIEKAFRALGYRVSSSILDLGIARQCPADAPENPSH
jgi:hypothetical protein